MLFGAYQSWHSFCMHVSMFAIIWRGIYISFASIVLHSNYSYNYELISYVFKSHSIYMFKVNILKHCIDFIRAREWRESEALGHVYGIKFVYIELNLI